MGDFFKDLVYSKEDVLTFPAGIPGFEKNKEFVIVTIPEYQPFEWLVCVDGSRLRFAIINPLTFLPDYSPNIVKEQMEDLAITRAEDILLYVIVTIRENPLESTANLVGPIVINRTRRIGKQIIIDDERYTTQEPILRKK
ncbi:MAG: flagellar assembly protein FliW [Fibrobacter sp.]|jgi:flagellar assembly factor FliW|nr:flagellar assembly protein FliW [Fibrobacter sp.]HON11827.1 flagellar assembly protein FliW [Chitinispirillaceae bacterium]